MLDLIDLDRIAQECCTAGFNQVKNCCNSNPRNKLSAMFSSLHCLTVTQTVPLMKCCNLLDPCILIFSINISMDPHRTNSYSNMHQNFFLAPLYAIIIVY